MVVCIAVGHGQIGMDRIIIKKKRTEINIKVYLIVQTNFLISVLIIDPLFNLFVRIFLM